MKIILFICLAVGWASTEKLDRTYLPPPGSKYSGGSPGDIQVPFEFPKDNYSTKRPQVGDGVPEIELGINRRPKPPGNVQGSTERPDGFKYFQNSYSVPKTTTSYAFTQTTTFAPVDYEGLDENSGFLNASSGFQQTDQPQYPQQSGQTYQQRQPIRGQSPSKAPNYSQYQQGQNYQSNFAPYGSTTQNPRAYLPPVPSFTNKGQSPTGQLPYDQDNTGYPSGRPQGPKYQDGQKFTSTTGPGFLEGGNQQNVFIGSPTTAAPQYQDDRYYSTTGPGVNQQRFGSRLPIPQNQQQFPGQNVPSSTAAPQFTTPGGVQQNIYTDQKFPSSTSAPQYQFGQRITTPGSMQPGYGPLVLQQNKYSGSQNFPSTTAAPQYQDGQQFVTPGSEQQNQYTENKNFPSTAAPQYQDSQRYSTPIITQEGFAPNQQRFGSQITNQGTQNQYTGSQDFPSTTAVPQLQNGPRFTTPGAVQQNQQNQYPGNQNFPSSIAVPQLQNGQRPGTVQQEQQNQYTGNQIFPSSTTAPQYQNGQRYSTPGSTIQYGSRVPSQQNQNIFSGNQNFPSSTTAPQYQNGQGYTTPGSRAPDQQNQNQYPGNQNFPSSTTAPQYQNGQRYTTPGSTEQFESPAPGQQNQNQYPGSQFFPSSAAPQNENGPQQGFESPRYTQQGQNQYQGNQNIPSSTSRPQYQNGQFVTPGSVQQNQYSGNQNIPSTASPQIQNGQRFTTSGPLQGVGSNQQNYPGSQVIAENGNQQYPSTVAPQYQSTLSPISGSNQGFIPNQQSVNQYPGRPGYNKQYPSTTAPQGLPQQQNGNDGKPILPGPGVSYPTVQGTPSTQAKPGYGNQPTSPTGSPVYRPSPVPGYINQGVPIVTPGSSDSDIELIGQNRPERPQAASDRSAEILNYENVLTPEGYSYSYDTSNGIHADETGVVDNGTKAQGGYSYTGDDGKVYSIFYSADENGFQPRGDHLPTSPPIPEAIQRVIEQASKDKEAGISHDGLYDEERYGHMKYDGPLSSIRPRNKTLVNGADIPNSYDSRIGGKIRKPLKTKGEKKPSGQEENNEDNSEFEYEDQIDEENFDDGNGEDQNRRISNENPTDDKNLSNKGNRAKTQKGEINNNANTDLMRNRKPVGGKGVNRRPVSGQTEEDGKLDNVSVTEIPEEDIDNEGSQDYVEDSDLINYKDDPNSRTDFHGINRYLPNPKGSNRFNQNENKRVLVRPGGTKQKGTGVNKIDRTGIRKNQANEYTIPGTETEPETGNSDGIRIPNKNRIGQKKMGSMKLNKQKPTESNDEIAMYGDDGAKVTEEYFSEDELVSGEGDFPTQPVGKPKRPNVNERTGISKNKNIQTISDEETGYEYTPPQRKFESEGAIGFPSRTKVTGKPQFTQKGVQTTVRPFMTPNVYENDKTNGDIGDQFNTEGKPYRPVRPTTPQNQKNPENTQSSDRNNGNAYPGVTEKERFDATGKPIEPYGTTPSRRPFGKPTTAMPVYKDQGSSEEDRYNEPMNYQGPRRPGNKLIYSTNAPNKGASKVESNAFVSTTPLPTGYEDNQRPGQYQDTNIPNDGSTYFEGTAPSKDGQRPTPNRPEITNSRGQVPSTTFRPSYTFADKTLAPNGPITVDGFGRPIASTNAPIYGTTEDSRISIGNQPGNKGEFRPGVGRFGVTSAPTKGTTYSSTQGPVEDFSGPKQPQRFDPDTGYHY